MNPPFILRGTTLADLPTITAHRRAMFEEMGFTKRAELDLMSAKFEAWVTEKMAGGNYAHWFAVNGEDEIVAGAGLWLMEWPPVPTDPSARRGCILNVYTHPDFRSRGLAKRLTLMILDWCRERGIRTVILHASDAGRAIYKSLGFCPTNEMRIEMS